MTTKTLADIAKKMSGIDIAILSTHSDGGQIASRPMSNNGDVTYDGNSYYFTSDGTLMVRDISNNPKVALGFTGKSGIFTPSGLYIAVEGNAELIRDKVKFKQHWVPDLDVWFDKGVDTPGLVLIKIRAVRIKYWDGREEGEVKV